MKFLSLLLPVLLTTSLVQAEPPLLLKPGSSQWNELFDPPYAEPKELPADLPLRKDLFDLLRPTVERAAGQKVLFEGKLRAFKNWAYFGGRSLDVTGKSLKLPPFENDDTSALWLRTKDGWRLVDYSAGHSDAFFLIWPEQYGTPRELLHAP